jgi:hypothetical protein
MVNPLAPPRCITKHTSISDVLIKLRRQNPQDIDTDAAVQDDSVHFGLT